MALETTEQIEALADELSRCADSIHSRLMVAIKEGEIKKPKAQLIFQDESSLRQFASGLYIDAANCVVDDLEEPQQDILNLVDSAKNEIQKIKEIASFIDLIADLLVLAAAAYAGKPKPILSALKEIRKDVKELKKLHTQ